MATNTISTLVMGYLGANHCFHSQNSSATQSLFDCDKFVHCLQSSFHSHSFILAHTLTDCAELVVHRPQRTPSMLQMSLATHAESWNHVHDVLAVHSDIHSQNLMPWHEPLSVCEGHCRQSSSFHSQNVLLVHPSRKVEFKQRSQPSVHDGLATHAGSSNRVHDVFAKHPILLAVAHDIIVATNDNLMDRLLDDLKRIRPGVVAVPQWGLRENT